MDKLNYSTIKNFSSKDNTTEWKSKPQNRRFL